MSDLFGWFQSYLNLSKIAALTVPGMVIAFALILVLGPIPCRDDVKNCPYCTDSLKPVAVSPATQEAENLEAHFLMTDPTGIQHEDGKTLVVRWDSKSNSSTAEKSGQTGPSVIFTSTSNPDASDVATYKWTVDNKPICGTSETTPAGGNSSSQTKSPPGNKADKKGNSSPSDSNPAKKAKGSKDAPPTDQSATPKADFSCKQILAYTFPEPGSKDATQDDAKAANTQGGTKNQSPVEIQDDIHQVTLTVTNKDGKSATVSSLVAILRTPPTSPLDASMTSCFYRVDPPTPLQDGATCPQPKLDQFPEKFSLPYGESRPVLFQTGNVDPKAKYLWKQDGKAICSGRTCLIPFNSPDGKANPTGTWAVSLEVTKDKKKSTAEQLLVRNAVPAIVAHPTGLSFLTDKHGRVLDSPQTQLIALRIAPELKIPSFAISKTGPGRDLFAYFLTEKDEHGKDIPLKSTELVAGREYLLHVNYSPDPWYSPRFLMDRFRAKRGASVNATLSIVALDQSTGVEKQLSLSIPLSAAPDPDLAVAAADASKKKKLANNTLITSSDTFLKTGTEAKGDVNRVPLTVSLKAILPNDSAVDTFTSSCKGVPVYVVSGSRPPTGAAGSAGGSSSESKQGTPQYAGETATSVQDILTVSDECVLALTQLDQDLQGQMANAQAKLTQDSAELTALTTGLTAAQTAGNQLIVKDLQPKVGAKTKEVRDDQTNIKSLTQADTYVTGLISSTTTNEKGVISQVNSGPAAASTNAVTDVFSTIQQHFLMFLLFSLVIGQMFDPIQRGLLSFAGPRRNVFVAFNKVYGTNRGDGEFRYGDRRLPPWTAEESYLPDLREPATVVESDVVKKNADEKGLRYSPADFLFRRNMNIYDQNYAIGAGYISQSDFNLIYNEFFRESQITTGLILPLLILSICIGIRYICCSTYSAVGSSSWWAIGSILAAVYFAVVIGLFILLLVACTGSREYAKVFSEALQGEVLARRYAEDKTGRELQKEWQDNERCRQRLERQRDELRLEQARLKAREQHLDSERNKRKTEAQAVEIAQQMRAAYLHALKEFPPSPPSSDYAKWLFEEGTKLQRDQQQIADMSDLEKARTLDQQYDSKRKANDQLLVENRDRLKNNLDAVQNANEKRKNLISRMRSYKENVSVKWGLRDMAEFAWKDPFLQACTLLLVPCSLLIFANLQILDLGTLPVIAMPSLFLAPLWVAGLDRLHKYYSELQARISGNILRQQQTTIQKMVDVVTSSSSKKDLMTNLSSAVAEQGTVLNFLENSSGSVASNPDESSVPDPDSDPTPPATPPADGSDEPKGDG